VKVDLIEDGAVIDQTTTDNYGNYVFDVECSKVYDVEAQTGTCLAKKTFSMPDGEGRTVSADLSCDICVTADKRAAEEFSNFLLSLMPLMQLVIFFFVMVVIIALIERMGGTRTQQYMPWRNR
jgi:hypothetical protein